MPYAWGSHSAIARITGRAWPTATPEAELWMGDHPVAPARVTRGTESRSLIDVIAEGPTAALGPDALAAFGKRLPFLMKILAAEQPLSLQAHPNESQARAGFAEEERRGIPRNAPARNYRDASHKPELLCALTPFDALCGFRRVKDTLDLFDELDVNELEPFLEPLRTHTNRDGLTETFRALMSLPREASARIVAATVSACAKVTGSFVRECQQAVRLSELYPGDIGVVSALLLNLVHLDPGEAIYLGAGNLHAYLGGVGVEIMASSDNVLRGGLTQKHVDVPELMRILDFHDGPIVPIRPGETNACERIYETPAKEFRLSVLKVTDEHHVSKTVRGPEIVLCTEGRATLIPASGAAATELCGGRCAFVPASTGRYEIQGAASLYRATVNFT